MGMPRRPVRWIEGNSAGGAVNVPLITNFFNFSPTIDVSTWPVGGGTELIFGDDDLDWMDDTEATIERVVGDISLSGFYAKTDSGDPDIYHVYTRMGLLTVEEVEDIAAWVPPSLWDREAVEEYEWMWMRQDMLRPSPSTGYPVTFGMNQAWFFSLEETIHIDLHVRRKLGKKDHLVLLAQFGTGALLEGGVLSVTGTHLLRVLFKTK